MFKLYDFDNNNYLTREEIVYLMRSYVIASRRPAVSNDIEKKTDDFIKNADLDLDRRISLKEFQSYMNKNRDLFVIFDNYSNLLSINPMSNAVNSINKEQSQGEEIDQSESDQLESDLEMDPDLYAELSKDKLAEERKEEDNQIKSGNEYKCEKNEKTGMFEIEEEAIGDNVGSACKPWITNLVHTVPSSYKPSSLDGGQPDANMELEFIHGYRCHDTRNNLRYTESGSVVYHTAAVGIVYNKLDHTQQFYFDHMDDITAMAIHPNKNYIATGEIGPYPLIAIWDTNTMQPIAKFNGPLQKGINNLAFSKDGKYLAATAADDNHGVAIYEWGKGAGVTPQNLPNVKAKQKAKMGINPILSSGDGGRSNILGICFNNSNDTLALTCVKEVNLINFSEGKFVKKKATGLKGDELTSIMCCVFLNNTLVCGSFKGTVLTFTGSSFSKSIKAHTSAVNCISLRDNNTGFITGGNDGMILIFDTKFTITMKLSVLGDKIGSLNPRVRSVCEDGKGNTLVGTRGGDILEFQGQIPNVLLRGHFDLELWGLTIHPKKSKYFTIGQDKMLALWDVATRKIEKFTSITEPAEFMHISSDGKDLAIGSKSGSLHIYDAITLEKKVIKAERKGQPIGTLRYSPDGKYLAVGGVDAMIFIYEVPQNYKRVKKLIGHTSRVTHIDWSADSEILQSNSSSYELLYHNVLQGTQITSISSLRDTEWFTWSCVFGWPVQGIWPPCSSGDDINSVDRDKRSKVIVTGDDFGKVKLFRYPSSVDKASFKPYIGHSSHVTCVRFSSISANAPPSHVISIGGNDKAIFQWKFFYEDQAEKEAVDLENINENDHIPEDQQGKYFKEEEMQVTECGASRPWIGEVKASKPQNYVAPKNAHLPPSENIKKLRYVFGYRAFDTRNNIKYTHDSNKIVYHTAALGIVLDKSNNTQTYFTGHEEDIVALAIHPNKKIIATGQMAKAGKAKLIDMYVWDITTLPKETNCEKTSKGPIFGKEVKNLKGCHLRAIRILLFSPDGSKLLSGGQDDDNSIAVHDWEKSTLIVKSPVDKARVLDAVWTNNQEFVTVGPKHIKFFSLNGRAINAKKGVFGNIPAEPLISVCSAFENRSIITGSSKGNIIVWAGSSATIKKELYKGPVYCLYSKDNLLYVGGFDGSVCVFTNSKLAEKKEAKLDITKFTRCDPGIRSIDINDKNNILIGTKGGDIIEIIGKNYKTLMNSHSEEELWGLAVNPANSNMVATGGGDKTLRIWDIKTNKQIKFWMCDQDFRAIDWSKDGKIIAVATMLGKIYCISVEGDKCVPKGEAYQSIFKGDKQWIQEIKISPNNKYVAYGSHCGIGATFSKIEVLNLTNSSKSVFTQYAVLDPKITSALTHLDWDIDSELIVCNSLAFELKFVSISAKKRIDSSAARDREWFTWTCLFGFPVQGIWPPESTNYVVNYTCMANNKKVLATGDDFSLVKLFRCPSTVEKSGYKAYSGHSSHIPKIRFSANDSYLISVGGNDKSVFIWETDFGKFEEIADNEDGENENEEGGENENEEEEDEEDGKDEEEEVGENENEEDGENGNEEDVVNQDEDDGENQDEEDEPEDEPEPPKKTNKLATNKTKNPPSKFAPTATSIQTKNIPQNKTTNNKPNSTVPSKSIPKSTQIDNFSNSKSKQIKPLERQIKSNSKNKMTFEEDDFDADQAGAPGDQHQSNYSNENENESEMPDNISNSLISKSLKIAPKAKLQLDYVFGYRTKDTKNNLTYLNENEIAYHAGTMGIILNLKNNTQSFFTGHKEDILSLAISETKKLIATGENNPRSNNTKPSVCIWDTDLQQKICFQGMFEKGINIIAFSPMCTKLLAVSIDDNHTIFVFDINQKKLINSISGDSYKILDACFKNEKEFATVGLKHFKYWIINDNANELISKQGVFLTSTADSNKIDNKLGLVKLNNGKFITGSATGEITIWDDDKVVLNKKCHSKNVDCICIYSKDQLILSGGRDQTIVVSDKNLSELRRIILDSKHIDSALAIPRSLEVCPSNTGKLLLGTLSSEIYELKFSSGNFLKGEFEAIVHVSCHFSQNKEEANEIRGLTYIPKKDLFVTVSEDSTLRFWDANQNKLMEYFKLDIDNDGVKIRNDDGSNTCKALCVDVNPKETHLAVGFIDGNVRLYSIDDVFMISKMICCRKSPCTDIKFSPNGLYLAVATKEAWVDIFKTDDYTKLHSLEGAPTVLNKVDWSLDSNFLSCSNINGLLYYYNIKKGTRILRTSDLKNEEWDSWSRLYGWPLQGVRKNYDDVIHSCCRSRNEIKGSRLLAIGGDSGILRIYRYPCIYDDQLFLTGRGHSGKITNMLFSDNTGVLFTTSTDGCVIKWKFI